MKQPFNPRRNPMPRRSGSVLFCVLACLFVVTGIMFAMTKSTIAARRETQIRLQMRQTEYLLDAGVARAVSSLAKSAEYDGENWSLSEERTGLANARVRITVLSDDEQSSTSLVTIVATLGGDDSSLDQAVYGRTTRSRQFNFTPSGETKPQSTNENSSTEE